VKYLLLLLMLPSLCFAGTASTSFSVSIVVPERFEIISERAVPGGTELVVNSNLKEVVLNGVVVQLGKPGVQTIVVATKPPVVRGQ
jgi:hypothetical protein